MGHLKNFQLPLSGSPAEFALCGVLANYVTFNSLSRDHEIWPRGYVINGESELSTPSLGITNIYPHIVASVKSFQLPLSGSPPPLPRGGGGGFSFQLPLSGSPNLSRHTEFTSRSLAFNSLSRDHADYRTWAVKRRATARRTFNSLSRDHENLRAGTAMISRSPKLSTPSLGITSVNYRLRGRKCPHCFQLPLSGSRSTRPTRSRPSLKLLSTPSLGITYVLKPQ